MSVLSGIVPTVDGYYVMASLHKKKRGGFNCSIRKWGMHNKFRNMFLLNRSVCCGIPSFWQKSTAIVPPNRIAGGNDADLFRPVADSIDAELQKKTLGNNISSIVPDDAFLCGLPLLFEAEPQNSFVSVFSAKTGVLIGVVIDRKLVVVFNMATGKTALLESHLGRIKRYWKNACPSVSFPEHVYIIDNKDKYECAGFIIHNLAVAPGNRALAADEEFRALGCAIIGPTGNIPEFRFSAIDALSRILRTAVIVGSAAIILIATLFTLTPVILSKINVTKLHSLKAQYSSGIMDSREIRELAGRNDSLVRDILNLQNRFSMRTQWGRFLEIIGKNRPEGLFFEKLGSEPVAGSASKMRVAISGSAETESLVTDLIERLQKDKMISNVSLSFMEKNAKNTNVCNFRIICSINIINN